MRVGRKHGWAALVAAGLLLAGCSGGGVGGSEAADPMAGIAEEPAAQRDARGVDEADLATPGRSVVQTRAVIRRGEISLVGKDLDRARQAVDDVVSRHGGFLAAEETTNDRRGRATGSMLVIRVPEPAFDAAMDDLAEIGRTVRADRRSEDVTTEVIDVNTRVATQEASLARLRSFLRKAVDVDDMIRIESEIATRQAALESMKAQQKYLADQTALATITVRMDAADRPDRHDDDAGGFLAGLRDGWAALQTVLVGAATALGAALPFAVLLALLGVPTWLLLRSVQRRRPASPVPPVPPAPDAG